MKIGVLTWKLHNFGTALQAYALVQYVGSQNADTALLNYSLPDKSRLVRLNATTLPVLCKKVKNRVKLFAGQRKNRKAAQQYGTQIRLQGERFRQFYAQIPQDRHKVAKEESAYFNGEYDKILVGSDQVWNPKYFCETYFLDFAEDAKKYSYAASLGVSNLTNPEKAFLQDRLAHFQTIAVREPTGQKMLQALMPQRKVECVLDPTLLLSGKEWESTLNLEEKKGEKYILVYTLGENAWYKKAIRKAQNLLNISKVICITPSEKLYFYRGIGEIVADAGPVEFLNLLKNAEYVITDSFHGVCFSVNFQKQFTCLERFNSKNKGHENARVTDFLESVGLQDRMASNCEEISVAPILFKTTEEKLSKQKSNAQNYLKTILS